MIQGQLKDTISRSEVVNSRKSRLRKSELQVAFGEDEEISLFDANLIRGMLERQPAGIDGNISLADFPAEHDALISLIQREFDLNVQRIQGTHENPNSRGFGRKDAAMKDQVLSMMQQWHDVREQREGDLLL